MDGKDTLENLIVSYLLGELDEQEQAYVLDRIRHDEKGKQLYEDLRKTINLIIFKNTAEQVDPENEWKAFEEAKLLREHPGLFLNEAEKFGNGVIREVDLKRKTRRLKIISLSAVAASLLLIAGWGLTLDSPQQKARPVTAVTAKSAAGEAARVIRHLVNRSATAEEHVLEDGTQVRLAAGSELAFREPFDADRRDIRMEGSAYFKVAKDSVRPFTVYSAGIAVTALGTRFTVTAFKYADRIRVALHEGKVVVKGTDRWKNSIKKDYFLTSGQEFVFEKSRQAVLTQGETALAAKPEKSPVELRQAAQPPVGVDRPSMPSFGKGSWYMFNNQSLCHVFDQLARMYKTEIVYNRDDVSKMYFIGTFKQTDSLETVLKQIAATNDLKISREQQKFVVVR